MRRKAEDQETGRGHCNNADEQHHVLDQATGLVVQQDDRGDCSGTRQSGISIVEIIGIIEDGALEVCASADAEYDTTSEKVSVTLAAFTRRSSTTGYSEHLPQPWLPRDELVTEHLPREEAGTFAKDVFHSWVRKVRAAVPNDLMLRT